MRTFLILLFFIYQTANAQASNQTSAPAGLKTVTVPRELPEGADTSDVVYARFKVTEIKKQSNKAPAFIVVRFSCEPLRYSAWMVNPSGVDGEVAQISFDKSSVLNVVAFKQSEKTLVLEDAWGESEKSIIDRLRNTKKIEITFHSPGSSKPHQSAFIVNTIKDGLSEAERQCFE